MNIICRCRIYFPMQNLISVNVIYWKTVVLAFIRRDRCYAEGRLRDRKLANIWKRGFADAYKFTFFNTRFAHIFFRCETDWSCAPIGAPANRVVMLISFQLFADVYIITWNTFLLFSLSTIENFSYVICRNKGLVWVMDILYEDKLNCWTFNPICPFIFLFWSANFSLFIVICILFVPEFAKNTNLKINFYKYSPIFEGNVWLDKIKRVFLQ